MSITEEKVRPNSKPQEAFFQSSEYEVLYGGAAGGGKSWSLVVEPMRYIDYPRFTGIIFRRTYPELEGSIIPLTHHYYLNAGAVWNEQKKRYLFPSGATIRLGFMQYENDWTSYQGHEYAYQGYDELTNFTEDQYTMLAAWNRSRQDGIQAYRRAASNPGGLGHTWVKKRFVDVCKPIPDGPRIFSQAGKMYYQPMIPGKTFYDRDKESGLTTTRKFIPSKVFDNIDLLRINPNYLAQLLSLPKKKRKALLEGNWDVFEGQFFEEWQEDVHVIQPKDYLHYDKIHASFKILGGMDYGNDTFLYFGFSDYHGNVAVFDEFWDVKGTRAKKIADQKSFQLKRGLLSTRIKADTNMWIKDAFDVETSRSPAEDYIDAGIKLDPVSKLSTSQQGYRVNTNDAIKDALHWEERDGKIVLQPKVKIYARCRKLIETIPILVTDEKNVEDIADKQYDHPFDAFKYLFMAIRKTQPPKKDAIPEHLQKKINKHRNISVMSE